MQLAARGRHLNEVMDALRRVTQAIRLSSSAAQKSVGITGAQLFVLQELARSPVTSLTELVDRTLTDQSSVSVVVSRLVERGLVVRQRSQVDARKVELRLAARGRALLRRAPETAQARLIESLRSVSAQELSVTASVLSRLARQMGASRAKPVMFFEPSATSARRSRAKAGASS